ncbi:hypothetical protein [Paenibacillus sp. S150]|uniref:hypothetical protein n=1 Tax=Paenibacillus sp. S150 TaxID=2749826 RepID=UPI001C57835D|nr:hypothetical protein [Paenibacillus sp. S150]MBW4084616.1 hypothetical protein [Paenibacillus sp. S150]
MTQAMIDRLTKQQRFLVQQSLAMMDPLYDGEMELLRDEEESGRHNTRSSAHYALALLIRGADGDAGRARKVLERVMDMQFDCPDEIYHGTFRTSPQAALPPAGNYDWKKFAPGFSFFLSETVEKVGRQLTGRLSAEGNLAAAGLDDKTIRQSLRNAVDEVLPPVWRSYDPNWREFIACTFALILDQFEGMLPQELVRRMDEAMKRAAAASIDRRVSDAIPMNSNIVLMHIFIVHYYGHRFANAGWMAHADREAAETMAAYEEFGSLAEFNTSTYYGVDLTVLGMWRVYGKSPSIRQTGRMLEHGLWGNIAQFYNPNLENLSGPFSRAYEMELTGHSSIGVFLYLALGEGYEYMAAVNCETSHDPLIALAGVDLPEELLPQFKAHSGDRRTERRFRELCERDKPGENRNLCTAAAWIEGRRMLGAMSGSRNTNGQMHPATIHWMNARGEKCYLRLLRREKGKGWNTHLRGVIFEAGVEKDLLAVDVRLDTDVDIEVYFEISGPGLSSAEIAPERWLLPNLSCTVSAAAPDPAVYWDREGKLLEIIYLHRPQDGKARMSFTLRLDPLHP